MNKINRTYPLSTAVVEAIEILKRRGYSLPDATLAGVVENSVRAAWAEFCPGEPFPQEGEKESEK